MNVASGFELIVMKVALPDAVTVDPTKLSVDMLVPMLDPSSCTVKPPPAASAPTNFLDEESYLRNLPLTFAVALSTSSRNSSRTSPPPDELTGPVILILSILELISAENATILSSIPFSKTSSCGCISTCLPSTPGLPCSP